MDGWNPRQPPGLDFGVGTALSIPEVGVCSLEPIFLYSPTRRTRRHGGLISHGPPARYHILPESTPASAQTHRY